MTKSGFDIDEIERLLAAATPGEWVVGDDGGLPFPEIMQAGSPFELASFTAGEDPDENMANAYLTVALHNSAAAMIAELRELRAENARLREESTKAGEPHWFYAEGWEERCLHSPDEAIDLLDFPPGEYVTEVSTARPCPSIWCAVRVSDDEDADERFTFTEHETEADARAALGEPQ